MRAVARDMTERLLSKDHSSNHLQRLSKFHCNCNLTVPFWFNNKVSFGETLLLVFRSLYASLVTVYTKNSPLTRAIKHCGKGDNAGYQQFLLFLWCFQKPFLLGP